MSDEKSTPLDLTSLEKELAEGFLPAWTKETNTSERLARMAGDDRSDDPRRSGGRGPHRGGLGRGGPGRDAGRGGRGNAGRGGPSGTGERRDRPARGPGGGPGGGRGDGGRRRDDRRGRGPGRDERAPAPRPAPVLTGWNLQVLPDSRGVDKMADLIRASGKAYPLFDLARLVLEKPERYRVSVKKADEAAPALYRVKPDGSLWLGEREAVQHVLARHRDLYYRTERVAADPPKGNFAFIAKCGMSGVLLGPHNHHQYQSKLLKLHAERFADVPFDVFKKRVRMVNDEETLAKWKDEQSWREEFLPVEPAPATIIAEDAPQAGEPTVEVAVETPAAPGIAESEAPMAAPEEETTAEVVPEASDEDAAPAIDAPEAAAAVADASDNVGDGDTNGEAAAAPEEAPPAAPAGGTLASMAEVEEHFRAHHMASVVERVRSRIEVPGTVALETGSPALVRMVRDLVEDLRGLPLPMVHVLTRRMSHKSLHVFKARGNITHIAAARPRHLDREAQPVSEPVAAILDYLDAHSREARDRQWQGLIALRTAGGKSTAPGSATSTTATPSATVPESAIPAEVAGVDGERAMAADLSWLVKEGYVTDFINGNFQVVRRPQPQKPGEPGRGKKKRKGGTGAVAAGAVEAAPQDAPAVVEEEQPAGEIPAVDLEVTEEPDAVLAGADEELEEAGEIPEVVAEVGEEWEEEDEIIGETAETEESAEEDGPRGA